VVINAYSGKTTFYDVDKNDPILQAYASAFPNMFTPLSKMSAGLQAHLRYPPDLFSIQSAIYGRYHLTSPSQFYSESNAWQLSPTAGAGTQSQALQVQDVVNQEGQVISQSTARMAPLYQVSALPGSSTQTFTVTDAYVPAAQSNSSGANNLNMSAFMVATQDPGDYGDLTVYKTPQGTPGPANADEYIQANHTVSSDITLYDQHGSEVLLGNTLVVPVGQSIIYLRPFYVASSTNPLPQLTDVIGVLGQKVVVEPSLSSTLSILLGTSISTPGGSPGTAPATGPSTGTVPTQVQDELNSAQSYYAQALTALKAGDLGTYQSDINSMDSEIQAAQSALKAASGTSTSTATTTTTTTPAKSKSTSHATKAKSPTTTEPKDSTTTTTLASASAAANR
jgi:uncharacterized membrane protein (UPF0182 family)